MIPGVRFGRDHMGHGGRNRRQEEDERCHTHAQPPIPRGRDEHGCSAAFSFFFSVEPQSMGWCHPHSEWISPLHLTQSRKWLTDLPELYLYGNAQPLQAKKTNHRIPFINFIPRSRLHGPLSVQSSWQWQQTIREVSWEGYCYYRHRKKRQ